MAKHLKFGGSTIARTFQCPAWRHRSKDIPKNDTPSPYAAEGTMLHDWMETIVTAHDRPDEAVSQVENMPAAPGLTPELIQEKLIPAIRATYDVLKQYDINRSSILLEPFVELVPGQAGGSIDLFGRSNDGKTVVILDYKFGHAQVSPQAPQLGFYGLCAAVDPSTALMFRRVERLVMVIIQPTGDGPAAKIYDVAADIYLNDYEDKVYPAIDAADAADDTTPPVSGPECKYCPALPICPAKTGLAAQALRLPSDGIDTLTRALPLALELEPWIKAVKTLAHQQAESGMKIPGYKQVNKRAMRVWAEPEEAMKKVKNARNLKLEEACDIKLKSPPQLEKLCKAKKIPFKPYQDYITAISSGTTLTTQDDKRPEALPAASLEEMVALTS